MCNPITTMQEGKGESPVIRFQTSCRKFRGELENSDSRKKGSKGRERREEEDRESNKSVQTIVVKQLKASLYIYIYIRVSLGSRGGGRTEMTSPDRETDSRAPLEGSLYPWGRGTPAASKFFNQGSGVPCLKVASSSRSRYFPPRNLRSRRGRRYEEGKREGEGESRRRRRTI